MYGREQWGGTFEINTDEEEQKRAEDQDLDRAAYVNSNGGRRTDLDETQQSWLLGRENENTKKKKYVDLGCVVVSAKICKWMLITFLVCGVIAAGITLIVKFAPRKSEKPRPHDSYTNALPKALAFFDIQRSGKLPKSNNVSWRGNSGLKDGLSDAGTRKDLVGGFYDAGDHIKFTFTTAYTMTMLSWSVIEYSAKYQAIGQLDHVHGLIREGTDYLFKTFNASAKAIDLIYCQVGVAVPNATTPDDHYCWTRPEDMDYPRPVLDCRVGSDLGGEMAAAMAAASIVFKDDPQYSQKLVNASAKLFDFARNSGKRGRYNKGRPEMSLLYNSTNYYDEYMWGATWLYLATGNSSYLKLATTRGIAIRAKAFSKSETYGVLSWDNKLPAAQVLLTRIRMFLSPGYPHEELLSIYQNQTGIFMCSYLPQFKKFNTTKGGLTLFNYWHPQPLQYNVNAAFLANLFSDYLDAANIPGWYCGPNYFPKEALRKFAKSQMDYILGKNPKNISYVVGYGIKYPRHIHHRAASIPKDGKKYSCKGGWKWRDNPQPNPHVLTGALVAGPNRFDRFNDARKNYNYTEPTIAGNAGLVAALVSMADIPDIPKIDKNTIFSSVPPLFPNSPPPPAPWRP